MENTIQGIKYRVFDTETDGLLDTITKIHVLSYTEDGQTFNTTTDNGVMKEWLSEEGVLWVGHNSIGFDMPAINKVLGLDMIYQQFWDTLALSWCLYPDRPKHGLEAIGEEHSIKKVKVEDHQWQEGNLGLMCERVVEDVKINWCEFVKQVKRLGEIYQGGTQVVPNEDILRFIRYTSFRMDTLREQQECPFSLDISQAEENLKTLERLRDEKVTELVEVMPKIPVMDTKKPPAKPYKQDGSLSAHGLAWQEFLKEQGLPANTNTEVTYIKGWKDSKPTYHDDVKQWLFSLGWKPQTFKYTKNKVTGEEKKIPQIKYQKGHDREGELCDSVVELEEKEPAIEKLQGLSVIQHRIGLLSGQQANSGFLKAHRDGKLVAGAGGFTNTLRFKHRAPIANLPQPSAAYGEYIRGVLTCDPDSVMCGSDVVSLEDTLKQHFIYPYDPEYVKEMQREDYDPHLSLALFAGKITQEDLDSYTEGKAPWVKSVRKNYKTVNYAAQYGVQAKTLSRQSNLPVKEAQELLDMYWKKNWAINKVAQSQYVKKLKDGSMYLKNPVNGFYYSLRNDRDIFSTLVQGTGDYVFNLWTLLCRKKGLKLTMSYHDEWLSIVTEDLVEKTREIAFRAMEELNDKLKLNVKVRCDFQTGKNYAECH